MPIQVVSCAILQRSFAAAPSTLRPIPAGREMASSVPAATIQDHIPLANIRPFGVCNSLANPTVASVTAAAMGALTRTSMTPVAPSVPVMVHTTGGRPRTAPLNQFLLT